jgi:two-component system phosphate regulon sensor histidine kinase PhoR
VLSSGDSVADDVSLGMRELVQVPDSVRSQAGFDRLSSPETTLTARAAAGSLGKLSELNLSPRRAAAKAPSPSVAEDEVPEALVELKAERRKESVSAESGASQSRDQVERMAPRQRSAGVVAAESNREARVRMFEGVADAFELRLVDSGHFVLFRKIWHLGERYIQGALIDRASFIEEAVLAPYRRSGLDHSTGLVVAFDGDVLALEGATPGGRYISRPSELRGELLERFRLSAPLNGLELVLSVTELPPAPGAPVVVWTALILAFVLAGGLLLMERLGVRQLALVAQQQDFVAGVSHELKTPLTSIRMYSEMLCSGWGDDERRMTYYRYIHDESERLSRLIANVLQLARMNRDELRVNPEPIAVSELLELLRSRSATALERAGFDLTLDAGCAELAGRRVMADTDAMLQILLNLVDNALKFAADAEPREVQVGCRQDGAKRLCLLVRDFGPGVADAELKRIFRPFYRGGAATSRAVKGTGIGLALVARLVAAMAGEVKARNRNPGLEVRICLPLAGGPDDVR